MGRTSPQRWLGSAVLPIGAFALLWWAYQQMTETLSGTGSSFGLVPWWNALGWLVTVIASGFTFGIAVALSGADRGSPDLVAILVTALFPLAVVVHFFGFLSLGWSPILLDVFGVFLITPSTAIVSCVVVGFLAAAFAAPRLIKRG